MSRMKVRTGIETIHPNESQRALQAAQEYRQMKLSVWKLTYPQVAMKYNVSERLVKTAASLLSSEPPEVIVAIADGRMTVSEVAKASRKARINCGMKGEDWERGLKRYEQLVRAVEEQHHKCRELLASSEHVNALSDKQKQLSNMVARLAKIGK